MQGFRRWSIAATSALLIGAVAIAGFVAAGLLIYQRAAGIAREEALQELRATARAEALAVEKLLAIAPPEPLAGRHAARRRAGRPRRSCAHRRADEGGAGRPATADRHGHGVGAGRLRRPRRPLRQRRCHARCLRSLRALFLQQPRGRAGHGAGELRHAGRWRLLPACESERHRTADRALRLPGERGGGADDHLHRADPPRRPGDRRRLRRHRACRPAGPARCGEGGRARRRASRLGQGHPAGRPRCLAPRPPPRDSLCRRDAFHHRPRRGVHRRCRRQHLGLRADPGGRLRGAAGPGRRAPRRGTTGECPRHRLDGVLRRPARLRRRSGQHRLAAAPPGAAAGRGCGG